MNINGFRIMHIQESTPEKATYELNEFLEHCEKVGKEVHEVSYHTYRTSLTVHCYVIKYNPYTLKEKRDYHLRHLK